MLVGAVVDLSTVTATQIVVLGYAVNNVLPARLGELARAAMLRDRAGVSFAYSLTITLVERLLDAIAIFVLLGISVLYLNMDGLLLAPVVWIAAGLTGVSLGIALVLLAPDALMLMVSRSAHVICPRWHDRLLSVATSVINGLGYFREPVQLLSVFLTYLLINIFTSPSRKT